MSSVRDQSVQHKEMEVQTTPRQNNQSQQNQFELNQSQQDHEEQKSDHKQSDDGQEQFEDSTNKFEYKHYISPDQMKTQQSAPPLKKSCGNCTSGSQALKLKQQENLIFLYLGCEGFLRRKQCV